MNNWKQIWNNRKTTIDTIDTNDFHAVLTELMRMGGYDSAGLTSTMVDSLIHQHENLSDALNLTGGGVFEVGCGAGTHLYLFARDGFTVGGLDYSAVSIDVARKVLPAEKVSELMCAEACDLPTDKIYDAVFAHGVFMYFDSFDYAEHVLEKMLLKSRRTVAVMDVYDAASEAEQLAYRRRMIENYDERYKDLRKVFYPRSFFEDFAARHGLKIRFAANELEGYVNSQFTYHCFMEKF